MDAWVKSLPADSVHVHGCVVIGGQATGKTHWVKSQKRPQWVDIDDLVGELDDDEVEGAARQMAAAVHAGLWVLSSVWHSLEGVSAVVVLPPDQLRRNVASKNDGLTYADALSQANRLRAAAIRAKVPIYSSIAEATEAAVLKLTDTFSAH